MMQSFKWSWLAGWAVLLAIGLLLPGCANRKITKENFDKVQNGMTLSEVQKILGKGEQETGDGSNVAAQFGVDVSSGGGAKGVDTYVWESGDKKITIYFKQDKVTSKNATGL